MISMYASNPHFDELDLLLTLRARLKNPSVHFDLVNVPLEFLLRDIDDLEDAIEMFFVLREHSRE